MAYFVRRRRRMRCVHVATGRSTGAELLVDGGADVAHRCARREHLPRTGRHVDADRAVDAVVIPLDDVAVLGALLDEAIVIALVPER